MEHEKAAIILFCVAVLFGATTAFVGFVAIFVLYRVGVALCSISIAWWFLAWMSVRWMS